LGAFPKYCYIYLQNRESQRVSAEIFGRCEGFFKEVVITFSTKVSSLNEAQRKEQKIPSPYHMKYINSC